MSAIINLCRILYSRTDHYNIILHKLLGTYSSCCNFYSSSQVTGQGHRIYVYRKKPN